MQVQELLEFMGNSYVEFTHDNGNRFNRLKEVYDALREAKQTKQFYGDAYWLRFFDAVAQAHFWWPTEAEQQDWLKRWQSTPVDQRYSDPSLQAPWHFGSMIEAFRNGDYALVACTKLSDMIGRLEFRPFGWPYGGTDCMKALIEAFDLEVIGEDE
jgi:hypothetical protein